MNNFSAECINYTEVPQTSLDSPPSSPVSARSLAISWINPARRRPQKPMEALEMVDIAKAKAKERKGEH